MKKLIIVFVSSLWMSTVFATVKPITVGVDYTLLSAPVPVTNEPKGVVNVKEFFSFTCIHCKNTEPLVEQILVPNKKIDLNKIQVTWGTDATLNGYAKLNATLQRSKLDKLYIPAFTAIFNQQNLTNPDVLKAFLAQNGLNADQVQQFMAMYNSFTIGAKVGEYKILTNSYNISGTPTFVVADKYMVSPAEPARAMEVIQYLVNKVNSGK